jgi:hypothetical protein
MFIDGCDWFRKLQSVWLTIIIWHNSSSFHRLYGKTLMFILLSYQTGFNPQYMFMRTTVFFCHGKNMDNGIKVFKLILNEFYTYLVGWNNKISKNYSLFSRLIHILMVINYFVIYSNSYMLVYVNSKKWKRRLLKTIWVKKLNRYFQIFVLKFMNFYLLDSRKI